MCAFLTLHPKAGHHCSGFQVLLVPVLGSAKLLLSTCPSSSEWRTGGRAEHKAGKTGQNNPLNLCFTQSSLRDNIRQPLQCHQCNQPQLRGSCRSSRPCIQIGPRRRISRKLKLSMLIGAGKSPLIKASRRVNWGISVLRHEQQGCRATITVYLIPYYIETTVVLPHLGIGTR